MYAGDEEGCPSLPVGLGPDLHGGLDEDPHTHLTYLYVRMGADEEQAEDLAADFLTGLRLLWEVPES